MSNESHGFISVTGGINEAAEMAADYFALLRAKRAREAAHGAATPPKPAPEPAPEPTPGLDAPDLFDKALDAIAQQRKDAKAIAKFNAACRMYAAFLVHNAQCGKGITANRDARIAAIHGVESLSSLLES